MRHYLRFGKIPSTSKCRSINFLKLTNDESERFAEDLLFFGYEEAIKSIKDDCFEEGLSVFEMDKKGMPALHTLRLCKALSLRLNDVVYEVAGAEICRGSDDEPVIKFEKIIKKRRIKKEHLINCILTTMLKNFKTIKFNYNPIKSYIICEFYKRYFINIETGEKKELFEKKRW